MTPIEGVRQRMDEALEAVRREFATVRTGKATPPSSTPSGWMPTARRCSSTRWRP
jgi:hypothetical protein